MEKELKSAVAVVPNRLYYVALGSVPKNNGNKHFFCIDSELVYWNFYLDFGPLNLGMLYKYCVMLNNLLNDPKFSDKIIFHYSGTHGHRRANAIYLISAWSVLYLKRTPEEAFKPFRVLPPLPSWHDATQGVCSYQLTVLDTLKGLLKAAQHRFFDFNHFNHAEYEHFEQVENGDLTWCIENKFIMFAGPQNKREFRDGYHSLSPDDFIPYFKRKNVELVVRLNKKYYEASRFTNHNIDHLELYFMDGSNPSQEILRKFLTRCESCSGAIAVHCKAGLGRTGCCIGAYIMKHHQFTAEELIGWLRIARPGSIIGPQQQYMNDIQMQMWHEGELFRSSRNRVNGTDLNTTYTLNNNGTKLNGNGTNMASTSSSTRGVGGITTGMGNLQVSAANGASLPDINGASAVAQNSGNLAMTMLKLRSSTDQPTASAAVLQSQSLKVTSSSSAEPTLQHATSSSNILPNSIHRGGILGDSDNNSSHSNTTSGRSTPLNAPVSGSSTPNALYFSRKVANSSPTNTISVSIGSEADSSKINSQGDDLRVRRAQMKGEFSPIPSSQTTPSTSPVPTQGNPNDSGGMRERSDSIGARVGRIFSAWSPNKKP